MSSFIEGQAWRHLPSLQQCRGDKHQRASSVASCVTKTTTTIIIADKWEQRAHSGTANRAFRHNMAHINHRCCFLGSRAGQRQGEAAMEVSVERT